MVREIVVTGGRNYDDHKTMAAVLEFVKPSLIIHGGATGADSLAQSWARANSCSTIVFKAEWGVFGIQAGPIRNGNMLKANPNAVVIAFPGGSGTADCVRKAIAANMIVLEVKK